MCNIPHNAYPTFRLLLGINVNITLAIVIGTAPLLDAPCLFGTSYAHAIDVVDDARSRHRMCQRVIVEQRIT
ncbi:hypothetical protein WDZ92_52595, partial [Nostoc sp. NIES-2111]